MCYSDIFIVIEFVFASETKEVIQVLHSSKDTSLAESMCDDLDTASYLTLPVSERKSSPADIDIRNLKQLKANVEATDKTLCVITNESSQQHISIMKDLLNLEGLHEKLYLLCINTYGGNINFPDGAYYRMFTNDSEMTHASARQFLSNVGNYVF